jgi:membrane protein CcdC involved in cytochrome C biogenesis
MRWKSLLAVEVTVTELGRGKRILLSKTAAVPRIGTTLRLIKDVFRVKVAEKIAQQVELAGDFWCGKHPLLMVWVCEVCLLLRRRNIPIAET